jgi:hypothetical protein
MPTKTSARKAPTRLARHPPPPGRSADSRFADVLHSQRHYSQAMPTPTFPPPRGRDVTEAASTDVYLPGQPVWVHHTGWQPGVVLDASPQAVMVRYLHQGRALGVDTVLSNRLIHRDESDPRVDDLTS